jgi:hypothetical protein
MRAELYLAVHTASALRIQNPQRLACVCTSCCAPKNEKRLTQPVCVSVAPSSRGKLHLRGTLRDSEPRASLFAPHAEEKIEVLRTRQASVRREKPSAATKNQTGIGTATKIALRCQTFPVDSGCTTEISFFRFRPDAKDSYMRDFSE